MFAQDPVTKRISEEEGEEEEEEEEQQYVSSSPINDTPRKTSRR